MWLQVEREWRRKEYEEAIKKSKEEEELNAVRRKQIEDQRRAYAFEIQREKEESEKIAKLNIEDIEKSKEMDNKNKMVNLLLRNVGVLTFSYLTIIANVIWNKYTYPTLGIL